MTTPLFHPIREKQLLYAIMIARPRAATPKPPLTTTRPAAPVGFDDPLAAPAVAVAAGVAVAIALTPPVTGPLSFSYKLQSCKHCDPDTMFAKP